MSEPKFLQIAYSWRERNGNGMSYIGRNITASEAEESARAWGWPGHDGAWWRYALDDMKALFARISA